MKTLEMIITEYMEKHPPAKRLFEGLKEMGSLYLIGGVLREYLDHHGILELRDIDMVADVPEEQYETFLQQFKPEQNAFGGYKICCDNLIVDVWRVEQTWAYAEGKIVCTKEEQAQNLPLTVFLNMDGLVYDLKQDKWYDEVYRHAVETGVLDVVLEDNPQIALNILRCMIIRKKYDMQVSDRLKDIIQGYDIAHPQMCDELYAIQIKRYGREVLTFGEMEGEVGELKGRK